MTDGILVTNTNQEFAKIEKASGKSPHLLQMTASTFANYQKNKESGMVEALTRWFNKNYREIRQALIAAETEKAEQRARDAAIGMGLTMSNGDNEALEFARIRMDEIISKLSSLNIVKPKLARLKLETNSPETVIVRKDASGKIAVATTSPFATKALLVPLYFKELYTKISKNSSLYKLADTVLSNSTQQVSPEEKPKVASWRTLFEGNNNEPTETKKDDNRQEEIPTVQIIQDRTLTTEDLKDRRMKAQIGSELKKVRELLSGVASNAPFNAGLVERENVLLKILSELTGVKFSSRKLDIMENQNVTDFQKMVDSIVGYKAPPTREEYLNMQQEMQDYYGDPNVAEKIRSLQEKTILQTFNSPEFYESTQNAERIAAEARAKQLASLEILGSDTDGVEVKIIGEKTAADINGTALDSQNRTKIETKSQEHDELVAGAMDQAKRLQAQNEFADLVNSGAPIQAQMLFEHAKALETSQNDEGLRKLSVEITSVDSNYIRLISSSVPIRVAGPQLLNMIKRMPSQVATNIQDELISLRNQIDELVFGGAESFENSQSMTRVLS